MREWKEAEKSGERNKERGMYRKRWKTENAVSENSIKYLRFRESFCLQQSEDI